MKEAISKVVQMKDDQLVANMKREEVVVLQVRETVRKLQRKLAESEDANHELRSTIKRQQAEIDEISMMLKTAQMQVEAWCKGPNANQTLEDMRAHYEQKCKKLSDTLTVIYAKNKNVWGPMRNKVRDLKVQVADLSSSTSNKLDALLTTMKQDLLLAFAEADPKDWVEPCNLPHIAPESVAGMRLSVGVLMRAVAQVTEVIWAVQEFVLPQGGSGDDHGANIFSPHRVLKRLTDVLNGVHSNIMCRFEETWEQHPEKLMEEQVGAWAGFLALAMGFSRVQAAEAH